MKYMYSGFYEMQIDCGKEFQICRSTKQVIHLCSTRVRFPAGRLGVVFFATGPGLGLIMYIFTILEFSTHNLDFHLLTISVNANIIIKDKLISPNLTTPSCANEVCSNKAL